MEALPIPLYRAEQARELDRLACERLGIPSMNLMHRAGQSAFACLREYWPRARHVAVVCGPGNNAGDGYVLARLAIEAGLHVRVCCPGDVAKQGDARQALQEFLAIGGHIEDFSPAALDGAEVIVDALFGSGLSRPLEGRWREAVEACNDHPASILALDIPSGLHADTGAILGTAIVARRTICFIAVKRGMVTHEGPDCCGQIHYTALGLPASLVTELEPAAERFADERRQVLLRPRRRSAHKGDFGHLLIIGGAPGMAGAVRLAAEAALRTGVGLVSMATHPLHATMLDGVVAEAMCHGVSDAAALGPLLDRATVLAIGPGLGRDAWGKAMFETVMSSALPKIVDADALNLLADRPDRRDDWILTPHPGEAARLLGMASAAQVQADRFAAVEALQRRYGGTCLLKGAGTLIQGDGGPIRVITSGNPGMASGGMGDVLTGVIAALHAAGLMAEEAACLGAHLHGRAGDLVAGRRERGIVASDLVASLRMLVNP